MTAPSNSAQESLEGVTVLEHQWAGGEYVGRPGDIDISLQTDQIMQRYLMRRIFREVEFLIKEIDGSVTVGYITGFDTKCIQMSTAPASDNEDPRSVLIFWPIARIEETGRRLEDLGHEHRSAIRGYSHALKSQCEAVLNSRSNIPNRRREPSLPG